jgi:hypothetical protein
MARDVHKLRAAADKQAKRTAVLGDERRHMLSSARVMLAALALFAVHFVAFFDASGVEWDGSFYSALELVSISLGVGICVWTGMLLPIIADIVRLPSRARVRIRALQKPAPDPELDEPEVTVSTVSKASRMRRLIRIAARSARRVYESRTFWMSRSIRHAGFCAVYIWSTYWMDQRLENGGWSFAAMPPGFVLVNYLSFWTSYLDLVLEVASGGEQQLLTMGTFVELLTQPLAVLVISRAIGGLRGVRAYSYTDGLPNRPGGELALGQQLQLDRVHADATNWLFLFGWLRFLAAHRIHTMAMYKWQFKETVVRIVGLVMAVLSIFLVIAGAMFTLEARLNGDDTFVNFYDFSYFAVGARAVRCAAFRVLVSALGACVCVYVARTLPSVQRARCAACRVLVSLVVACVCVLSVLDVVACPLACSHPLLPASLCPLGPGLPAIRPAAACLCVCRCLWGQQPGGRVSPGGQAATGVHSPGIEPLARSSTTRACPAKAPSESPSGSIRKTRASARRRAPLSAQPTCVPTPPAETRPPFLPSPLPPLPPPPPHPHTHLTPCPAVTGATVGYGDFSPTTPLSRFVCIAAIIVTITWIPTQIAELNAAFAEPRRSWGELPGPREPYVLLVGHVTPWQLKVFVRNMDRMVKDDYHRPPEKIVLLSPLGVGEYGLEEKMRLRSLRRKLYVYEGDVLTSLQLGTLDSPINMANLTHAFVYPGSDSGLTDDSNAVLRTFALLNFVLPSSVTLMINRAANYHLAKGLAIQNVLCVNELQMRLLGKAATDTPGILCLVSNLLISANEFGTTERAYVRALYDGGSDVEGESDGEDEAEDGRWSYGTARAQASEKRERHVAHLVREPLAMLAGFGNNAHNGRPRRGRPPQQRPLTDSALFDLSSYLLGAESHLVVHRLPKWAVGRTSGWLYAQLSAVDMVQLLAVRDEMHMHIWARDVLLKPSMEAIYVTRSDRTLAAMLNSLTPPLRSSAEVVRALTKAPAPPERAGKQPFWRAHKPDPAAALEEPSATEVRALLRGERIVILGAPPDTRTLLTVLFNKRSAASELLRVTQISNAPFDSAASLARTFNGKGHGTRYEFIPADPLEHEVLKTHLLAPGLHTVFVFHDNLRAGGESRTDAAVCAGKVQAMLSQLKRMSDARVLISLPSTADVRFVERSKWWPSSDDVISGHLTSPSYAAGRLTVRARSCSLAGRHGAGESVSLRRCACLAVCVCVCLCLSVPACLCLPLSVSLSACLPVSRARSQSEFRPAVHRASRHPPSHSPNTRRPARLPPSTHTRTQADEVFFPLMMGWAKDGLISFLRALTDTLVDPAEIRLFELPPQLLSRAAPAPTLYDEHKLGSKRLRPSLASGGPGGSRDAEPVAASGAVAGSGAAEASGAAVEPEPEVDALTYGELRQEALALGFLPIGLYRMRAPDQDKSIAMLPYVFTNPPNLTTVYVTDRMYALIRVSTKASSMHTDAFSARARHGAAIMIQRQLREWRQQRWERSRRHELVRKKLHRPDSRPRSRMFASLDLASSLDFSFPALDFSRGFETFGRPRSTPSSPTRRAHSGAA